MKKTTKALSVVTAYGSQISSAGAQFESSVSSTVQDFKAVRGLGQMPKSWSSLQAAKTLTGNKSGMGGVIGGSPGDLILKGVKKVKEKRSEKKKEEE